jgi:hypothetical protein
MQTLSLFPTPLFTNKQSSTFKASAVSEAGIAPLLAPRLQQDTVSFAPKIRSGVVTSAPALSEGELSAEQRQLLLDVFKPYMAVTTYYTGPSFSSSFWKRELKKELAPSGDFSSQQLRAPSLLKKHLPEAYQADLAWRFSTIPKDHDALKPYQTALAEAQNRIPEMPSETFLNDLPPHLKETALPILLDSKKLLEEGSFINYITSHYALEGASAQEGSNYSVKYRAYIETIRTAERDILREQVIQQDLADLKVFRKTAKSLGLLSEFNREFKRWVTQQGTKIVVFSTQPQQQDKQYEKFLRVLFSDDKQSLVFPPTIEERSLYPILLKLFSEDRKKKVQEALGLLKNYPDAVKAVIEELRPPKP